MNRRGYILVEAVAAMAVLSIGVLAVHEGVRQSILTRGQARDYTQARFLIEELVGRLEAQPQLIEETRSGDFEGGERARFHWAYTVSRVELPAPPLPDNAPADAVRQRPYMGKIEATVTWKRQNRPFKAGVQTLIAPQKLYVPNAAS